MNVSIIKRVRQVEDHTAIAKAIGNAMRELCNTFVRLYRGYQ